MASIHVSRDLEHSLTTLLTATILNIYGGSAAYLDRSAFYSELIDIPVIKDTITNTNNTTFIMGKFNYQYKDRRLDGILLCAPPT